jgi:lipopolysaccharide heptosyltransferase I
MSVDPKAARRILIVRLSALGDVVHVLPLLDALRRARPDAHIGWLVEEASSSLLAGHPQIDRVWVVPRRISRRWLRRGRVAAVAGLWAPLLRELRAARYEVSIDAQCNFRSSLLARLSGAPRRVGFAPPFTKEKAHWLLTDRVAPPPRKQLKVDRNLELLRRFGIDARGARARLIIPAAARSAARAFRAGLGAAPAVALHPGVSGFGAFKCWSPERYAALARRLHAERGALCIVTWGPGERDLAQQIVRDADGAAEVAPETASILDLAALFEACDAVVGGDTGPVHLAAALGVPVIALYGPKDPAVYAPWDGRTGTAVATLWKRVHCSPCGLRRCHNVICMPAIQVEDVAAAVRDTLRDESAHTPVSLAGPGAARARASACETR